MCTSQDGKSALHVAAEEGHLNVVKLLLDFSANVNIETKVAKTIWMCILTQCWLDNAVNVCALGCNLYHNDNEITVCALERL